MKINLLREYIKALIKEDAMGFVHDLAAASEEGQLSATLPGSNPGSRMISLRQPRGLGKAGGKAIKRAFNANADHRWLSTLDTVHWGKIYGLADLIGKSKDELSTTMTLPGEPFVPLGDNIGLWIKGRITLAANDMEAIFTGYHDDYVGPNADIPPEEQGHRAKSSGVNKLPKTSKDYKHYGRLKRGDGYDEKLARDIPYVLDKSTWDINMHGGEALVDNWKPVGLIADWEISKILKKMYSGHALDESALVGKLGEFLSVAQEIGVPIFDRDRNILWRPE